MTEHLQRRTAHVTAIHLPKGPDRQKGGVDDYLLSHTTADLERGLPSSGSHAALRDLADYSAALAFADAEIVTDPK